jgi:hypothetical protein
VSGIRNQCDGVRQKSKSTFDDHEDHIESHGDAHSKVDATRRYQRMPVSAVVVVMVMLVIDVVVVMLVVDVVMIGVVMIVSVIMCDLVFVFHRV